MKAFPVLDYQNGENSFIYQHKGMDLRDYFAAKALNAFLIKLSEDYVMSDVASDAYTVADEMMKARNDS
jgi:hypothetical protein